MVNEKKDTRKEDDHNETSTSQSLGKAIPPYTNDDVDLFRRIVSSEVKHDILSWMKTQFWIVGIVITLIGWFGLRIIMESIFDDRISDLEKKATTALNVAEEKATEAETRSQELISNFGILESDMSALDDNLKKIRENLGAVRMSSDSQITKSIDALHARIDEIAAKLSDVAESVSVLGSDIDVEALKRDLKSTAITTQAEIETLSEKANISVAMLSCQIDDNSIICNANSELLQRVSNFGYQPSFSDRIRLVKPKYDIFKSLASGDPKYTYLFSLFSKENGNSVISILNEKLNMDSVKQLESDFDIDNSAFVPSTDLPTLDADLVVLLQEGA